MHARQHAVVSLAHLLMIYSLQLAWQCVSFGSVVRFDATTLWHFDAATVLLGPTEISCLEL